MSCNAWERGEFIIPRAEWAKFKAKIRTAINSCNQIKYEMAVQLHERVAARKKAEKNLRLEQVVWQEAEKLNTRPGGYLGRSNILSMGDLEEVMGSVHAGRWKDNKLVKPKKKDFPQYGNNVTRFENSDCHLTFDNETRKVVWQVREGNHTIDYARCSVLGRTLFATLDTVKWVRGTGGKIVGNDEYNRDSHYEGGGGNYEKDSWGPKSKSETRTPGYTFPGYR